jgi:spore maturation protein CgeB
MGKEDKGSGSDIVFVGNWNEEREQCLSELRGYDLAIWGTEYWGRKCRDRFLRSCWKGHTAIGHEMTDICLASKVNLNILRLQNKGSHNMRTFEIPACGGFMLHERSEEALELFEEGKEAEYYGSIEEFKDKINFYLNNGDSRMKIAKAGYERCIKSGYSYSDRANRILAVYREMHGT